MAEAITRNRQVAAQSNGCSSDTLPGMRDELERLYGDAADDCLHRIGNLVCKYRRERRFAGWSERDVILITYGDHVRAAGETPLQALGRFLREQSLQRFFSILHILPFFPYSSDDGFSVEDYRAVNPALGTWSDIRALGRDFQLAFDLVLNHCSQRHGWFQKFLDGDRRYARYFISFTDQPDTRAVVRPRNTPLLTPFETAHGLRYVWTTFSDDQIDLDYRNPDVLIEMLDVLLFYVQQGARIVRLDAVAYAWKEPGTNCINRPEVHVLIRLMRKVLEAAAPGTLLLTETNLPHEQNVSYWGDGDMAHLIYQFSLPPLLLDAFASGDARVLRSWLGNLRPAPAGASVVNFSASHDGIGLRPAEGLVPEDRWLKLIEQVRRRGGLVSTRRKGAEEAPYELNSTWYSAVTDPEQPRELREACFLASQAVVLGLKGVPAIYFSSLFGVPNDTDAVRASGHARSINRSKFSLPELQRLIDDRVAGPVYRRLRKLLAARTVEPCFHPDAGQEIIDDLPPAVLAWHRTSTDGSRRLTVVINVSAEPQDVRTARSGAQQFDLLSETTAEGEHLQLAPYQVCWLVPREGRRRNE